jgi:hypothetical protein
MVTAKDVAYACRRDGDAELCALTDDAQITPSSVLSRDAEHQSHDLSIERVVGAIVAMRERPIPCDEVAVPAHERRWRHEEGRPTFTR